MSSDETAIVEAKPHPVVEISIKEYLDSHVKKIPPYERAEELKLYLVNTAALKDIKTSQDKELVLDSMKNLKKFKREVLEHLKPFKKLADDFHSSICNLEKDQVRPIDQEVGRLDTLQKSAAPKVVMSGISAAKKWSVEVIDELAAIEFCIQNQPFRHLLTISADRLQSQVEAMGKLFAMPGVSANEVESTRIKAE